MELLLTFKNRSFPQYFQMKLVILSHVNIWHYALISILRIWFFIQNIWYIFMLLTRVWAYWYKTFLKTIFIILLCKE